MRKRKLSSSGSGGLRSDSRTDETIEVMNQLPSIEPEGYNSSLFEAVLEEEELYEVWHFQHMATSATEVCDQTLDGIEEAGLVAKNCLLFS